MRAAEVLRLVSGALQDLEPGLESRWPWEGGDDGRIGLLDFLNAAVRAVVLQRPDASVVTKAIELAPGMRQRLPRGATTLIELTRNMGSDGQTPGLPIACLRVDMLLAWADPTKAGRMVDSYAYDRIANSDVYYVCPGVCRDIPVYVEATYATMPCHVTSPDDATGIADQYAAALFHHIMAGVLSGDNESSNAAKANYHMQLFAQVLGVKMQVDASWPKTKGNA